jgi:mRNA interferase MazF
MRRGDYVTVAMQGDHGKPSPALIVQNDSLLLTYSVVVCPLTTTVIADAEPLRLTVEPNERNGLKNRSQIMLDKISSVPRDKIGGIIGHADAITQRRVTQGLTVLLKLI